MNTFNIHAYRATIGNNPHTQTVGALFHTGQEVDDQKTALRPQVEALHSALFAASANAPKGAAIITDFQNFASFYASWNSFWLESSSVVTASADLDRLADFRTQLAQWQSIYQRDTLVSGQTPVTLPAIAEPTNSGGNLGNAADTLGGAASTEIATILKVAALVGAGFLALEILPGLLAHR